MDYEFRKDSLTDHYKAKMSMEHVALGTWLESEIGHDRENITKVLGAVEQAKAQPNQDFLVEGSDYSVLINAEEAVVRANALGLEATEVELEELALYEAESMAMCGLEDFEQVILAWQAFVMER